MITQAKAGISKKKLLLVHKATKPHSYQQAFKDPNCVTTMEKEYQALISNNTWQLVLTPSHGNIIGCWWVYKLKYHPNETIYRYKAGLVAQGFTQTPGIDYFETFSLVHMAMVFSSTNLKEDWASQDV